MTWTWDTTGQLEKSIIVQTSAATTIYWGDGTSSSVAASTSDLTVTHTYTTAGSYMVGIKDNVVTKLNCIAKKISDLNLTNNTSLKILNCDNNNLTSLVLNSTLTYLDCDGNSLTSLNVGNNTNMTFLAVSNNNLSSLDVSKNTVLKTLWCSGNDAMTSLDVSQNIVLDTLGCGGNALTSLDLSKNIALTKLYMANTQISNLDVSKNTKLKELYCYGNQLTTLDVSKNTLLNKMCCIQSTMKTLTLNEEQSERMTIISLTTGCSDMSTSNTIHKYPNTTINMVSEVFKIQPNAVALSDLKYTTAFLKAKNMLNNNTYGVTTTGTKILDSHMMKNSEWGAVVYLTNAIGRNPYRNNSPYFTGIAGATENGTSNTEDIYYWNTPQGVKASSTHNVYGVYDLNGGKQEYVGAYVTNRGAESIVTDAVQTKNVDVYTELSNTMNYYGGALSETGNFTEKKSWNDSKMPSDTTQPYLTRGSSYDSAYTGDMFMAYHGIPEGGSWIGFRPVIIVKKSE